MKLQIPVASGLEAAVKREVFRLGYGDAPADRGRLELAGDWFAVARLNVFLRGGERVLIVLGEFPATTFDELYEGVRALPFEEFFSPHVRIFMDGKSYQSRLAAVKAAGGVAKKAIVTRLMEKFGVSALDERGERATVGFSIYRDVVTVTLDTTGDGLHRRGYRVIKGNAPLRETTAAAIIEDSFYDREHPFADPFCGCGTFPIEAALYARGIAPGFKRRFDFEKWKIPPKAAALARGEAAAGIFYGEIAPIFASDIDRAALETAQRHAVYAGVAKDIRFTCGDMRTFRSELRYGIMACNPPYGERMGKGEDLSLLYRDIARVYRALPDWSLYVVTAFEGAEKAMGKPSKRRILYNADLKCSLLAYFGAPPARER